MSGPSLPGRAETVFAQHIASLPSGAEADIETLCRANPDIAVDLRAVNQNYQALLPVLRLAGLGTQPQRHLADEIRSRYGAEADPHVSLEGAPTTENSPSSELLRRLEAHAPSNFRYRLIGEVGRGGMGAVLRVWDEDLRRTLAMKVVIGKEDAATSGETPPVDSRTLGRFLEEAQVTGQLDHPGIVPVHELGLDSSGRVYFTMKLVKGEDLRQIYEHVLTGKDGWNQTRALGVLLKVCEAMSYAHDKGVIHRDLKPANVMVGKYGEVYVMDWGLARVLGKKDQHDLRIQVEPKTSVSVQTERREEREETPDSPIVTMDGDVVGTPAYMPPEQARGETAALGPQSDVYAVGAMLYHLLAAQMPFIPRNAKVSARTVLMRVLEGPPLPVATLAPDAPAELVAICEKAMTREASQRYPDTRALAEDLRAFLEHRVVGAYETGTWAETRKWVQRNRALAASLATAVLLLLVGLTTSLMFKARADKKTVEATRLKDDAVAQGRELRVRGLIQDLAAFDALDDTLDYARSEKRPAYQWWLERARQLVDGQQEDPAKGSRWSPGLADVEARLARLRERAMPQVSTLHFAESDDEWWYAQLSGLVRDLTRLRVQIAIAERSVLDPRSVASWRVAIEAIAASEKYLGVKWPSGDRLTPQVGLIPIGPDPVTGLWEFSHLESGNLATRDSSGRIVLHPEMGMVFVLLPGGRVPAEVGEDSDQERSLTVVDLAPFFISKFEMTEAQWIKIGGWRRPTDSLTGVLMPVHGVSWDDSRQALSHAGWLELPTEAQWEFSARASSTTRWWSGDDAQGVQGVANIISQESDRLFAHLISIGGLRANGFGLHDVYGNVDEHCADGDCRPECPRRAGDGLCDADPDSSIHILRGGSSASLADRASSSARSGRLSDARSEDNGVRPARGLTR